VASKEIHERRGDIIPKVPFRLMRKPRAAGGSRPVNAIARDGQVDETNRVRISRAPFGYPD